MKQSTCESKRLISFLENTLPDKEVEKLTTHLDECASCVKKLEELAADTARWQEAKTHLSRTEVWEVRQDLAGGNENVLPFTIRQIVDMLDPTDDPSSLGRLGGYEIIGVVGSGAMGVVLKAIDQTLDRIVALKVMNPTLAACGTARHRFAREAKAAAGVLHPNVIAIHGVSTDRELPYLVMPYIAGTSLQQRMDRQGPLKLVEVLRIGGQIAAGLAAAHQKGVIHRDIKPSNVMLDEGVENAMITDFGLARTIDDATMTRSGSIAGTPEYMSPEQARGDTVDCASDIFSLGSLLYALCCGTRPFRAKTSFGVLRKITNEEPKPIRDLNPEIPTWLCSLIEKMHSKVPAERPDSIQVRDLLEKCLAHAYQPDQIPLPKELHKPKPQQDLFSFKTVLTGVSLMISLIAISTLAVMMLPGEMPPGEFDELQLSSTDFGTGKESTVFKTEKRMFPKLGQKGTLKVGVQRGFIEVVAHDRPNVVIEILTPPEYEEPNRQDKKIKTFFAPKYDLDVIEEKNMIKFDAYNQDYVLNLRIKVPRASDLDLDSYINGVTVKNVVGAVKAESQHGPIRLVDIAGSAQAYSRNGNLNVRFLQVAANAALDFESYNGNIDVALPQSIAATAAIASGTGDFELAFDFEPLKKEERPKSLLNNIGNNLSEYRFGKINGGGIPLRVEGENGRISIRTNVAYER